MVKNFTDCCLLELLSGRGPTAAADTRTSTNIKEIKFS